MSPRSAIDGSEGAVIDEALARKKAQRERFGPLEYVRLTDAFRGLPRGTARFGEDVVPGYPPIGRVLNLENGLRHHFEAPFHVEEKVDGYNVRIFRHQGELLALSRGGFICPFTTDRLPDLMAPAVFDAEPDLIVCAEVAGPGNPYLEGSPPGIEDDVVLFVFDLMRFGRPGFVPAAERYALYERHRLPAVPAHGRFHPDRPAALREVLRELDTRGVEGVVLKEDSARQKRAKYVTPASVIQDIAAMADGLMELPPEYFTNRLLRLALILEESPELDRDGLRERLGAALLDPLLTAVRGYHDSHKVAHPFRCRFRGRENAERFIEHLGRAPRSAIHARGFELEREEDGYWVLTFERIFPRTTGLLANFLSGGQVYD